MEYADIQRCDRRIFLRTKHPVSLEILDPCNNITCKITENAPRQSTEPGLGREGRMVLHRKACDVLRAGIGHMSQFPCTALVTTGTSRVAGNGRLQGGRYDDREIAGDGPTAPGRVHDGS